MKGLKTQFRSVIDVLILNVRLINLEIRLYYLYLNICSHLLTCLLDTFLLDTFLTFT